MAAGNQNREAGVQIPASLIFENLTYYFAATKIERLIDAGLPMTTNRMFFMYLFAAARMSSGFT